MIRQVASRFRQDMAERHSRASSAWRSMAALKVRQHCDIVRRKDSAETVVTVVPARSRASFSQALAPIRDRPFFPHPAEASMRVAIYARVSTDDKGQDPENQLRELRAWCINSGHGIFQNTSSTKAAGRVPTGESNSLRCSTTQQKGNSIACCFGRLTALVARAWRKRLLIYNASCRTASCFIVTPSRTWPRPTS